MVMELLRGEDLSQVLAREAQLPLEDAVDYVLQASHAISEAHARGIVHRDLKPSNLFVTTRSDGTPLVKVLDFGISKALNPDVDGPASGNLTATSAIMGSPLYMSPEQVRNAKLVDARTDIWALGVILHELLTGAPAFRADTLPGICAAITADDPPPLRSMRDDAPADLEAVLTKCLEKNASNRYQTTRELMAALRPFASTAGRVEPISVPVAQTMREAGSGAPPAGRAPVDSASLTADIPATARANAPRSAGKPRPSAKGQKGETLRSSAKMPGATSLASSTATLSNRDDHAQATGMRVRNATLITAATLISGATVGAFVWSRGARNEAAISSASVAPPPAARRTFVLFIDATPPGAEIWEGDVSLGHAPMQISIDNEAARKDPRRLVIRRPGFQPYSIVQGPSEENVHVIASLVAQSNETALPPAAPPAAPIVTAKEHTSPLPVHAKPAKGSAPRAEPVAPGVSVSPPAAPSAAAPPPPPSDIRLQR
jgi:Protein kinase domain